MNKLQRGLQQAMLGIICGIAVAAIMKAFVDDGLVPTYFVWLFILFGILGNIATINNHRLAGTIYTIGWLVGGLLLKDVLDTVSFIVYIVVPAVILALRVWQFINSNTNK